MSNGPHTPDSAESQPQVDTSHRGLRAGQFSLRALLWAMVAAGWLLVDVHSGRGLGVAGALIFAGATPLLADVLRRSPSFDSAVQLLLGVGIIFFVLALMLLATYLGWLDPHSGVHDYVTFSLIVFGGIFGLRIRWTAVERRCSLWAVWGYFACLVGAFMLKSVAMTFLIRRFH